MSINGITSNMFAINANEVAYTHSSNTGTTRISSAPNVLFLEHYRQANTHFVSILIWRLCWR